VIEGKALLIARCCRDLAVLTQDASYCLTGAGDRVTAAENPIDNFKVTHNCVIEDIRDGLMIVTKPGDASVNHAVSVYSGVSMQMPAGAKIELHGDFFSVLNPDGSKRIYYYFRHQTNYVLMHIGNGESLREIVRVGNIILIRRSDGSLGEYYVEAGISYIYDPDFVTGESAVCSLNAFAAVPARRRTAKIKIA
jgi:hypothetical protein